MPVQVEDIIPAEAAPEEAPPQEKAQEEAPQEEAPPAPKRRGRPPGSKNKPKPPAGEVEDIEEVPKAKPKPKPPAKPVRMKRAISRKVVIREEPESESEDELPPSPATQRKEQWANYRRAQVEAHQARTEHYTRALDRVLGY